MWERVEFCVIPPQLILQTIFCVINCAECHYTFLKINSQIIFLRVINFGGIMVGQQRTITSKKDESTTGATKHHISKISKAQKTKNRTHGHILSLATFMRRNHETLLL